MTWITLYFCAGIVFARFIRAPFWLIFSCAFILLIAASIVSRRGLAFKILFAGLIFLLGAVLLKNSCTLPKSHIRRFIFYKNETVFTVKGFVNSQPQPKDDKSTFIFSAQELEFNKSCYKTCGDILVHLKGINNLAYGDILILRGAIHKPFKLYSDKLSAVMHVSSPIAIAKLNKNCGWPLKRLAFYLKEKIEKIIYRKVSPLAASILDAMVLGEKRKVPAVIYDAMVKSGTVHILVVSGFNVGIVAFIIMLALKVLRLPRLPRHIAAIFCLMVYCLATGGSSPVVRATVMAIFFLGGFLLKREPDIRNSFALAALFILFIEPTALFSASFQLSFASVAAIIFLYPRLQAWSGLAALKPRLLKAIAEGCLVSLSAWLGTCGFILYYFKIFSPITVLANIFIAPLAALITLSAFSLVVISLILPVCMGPFASANEFLVVALLGINHFLIRIPFAYYYL